MRASDRQISVAEHLRRAMETLTPVERRVARTLLAGYPVVGLGSIADLAGEASTSAASVVRLVQKLGFNGFPDFQNALLLELSTRRAGPSDRLDRAMGIVGTGGVLKTLGDALADSVLSLTETIPESEFNSAVDLFADTGRRLLLIGGRISHNWAAMLATYLLRLRPNVVLLSRDPGRRTAELMDVSSKTVLVAFDFRRYETDTVETAQLASKRRSKVVLVTDVLLSPAAAHSDIVLPIEVEVPAPFDTSVTGVALIECIAFATMRALGQAGIERMKGWDEIAGQGLVK